MFLIGHLLTFVVMDIVTFLSYTALFYGALYFMDQFLKSCMNVPYLLFLENVGIKIQPFQINIFSTVFNRPVAKLAFTHKNFFKLWFSTGAIVVVLLLMPSIFLLLYNIMIQIRHERDGSTHQILMPVVPGINLPFEELPYYFLTLLMASVIHEVGHAVAAAEEDVHINGIGFILLYALPGAYVDLSKDGVRKLNPFKQLKILCAGVWHNVILAAVALVIGISLPYILSSFYDIDKGILVLNLEKNSPALGQRGLFPNDVIDSVNYCPTFNIENWRECFIKNINHKQLGFCIPEKIINYHDETIHHPYAHHDGSVECCDHSNDKSKLCFELQSEDSSDVGETPMQPFSCLPVTVALEGSFSACSDSSECRGNDAFCFAPSLRNSSRLLALSRSFSKENKNKYVIFLGEPAHLFFSVKISNFVPKLWISHPWFPYYLELLLDYLVKFSGALGLMNLIPCIYLDGYWISGALLELFFGNHFSVLSRRILHVIISFLGTSLLITTIALGIWNLI